MFDAVCLAGRAGAEQAIVSDANTVFIEQVLSHHGLRPLFTKGIHTNSGAFKEDGRLDIGPHWAKESPHGCPRCPPNMCKGSILEEIVGRGPEGERKYDKVVYVGDGKGDFCPVLHSPH
ncbi:unnamed protein product [Choristocarpus tenellus]